RGSEADDEEPGLGVAEPGQWLAPILAVHVHAPLCGRDVLDVGQEARAAGAGSDLLRQPAQCVRAVGQATSVPSPELSPNMLRRRCCDFRFPRSPFLGRAPGEPLLVSSFGDEAPSTTAGPRRRPKCPLVGGTLNFGAVGGRRSRNYFLLRDLTTSACYPVWAYGTRQPK